MSVLLCLLRLGAFALLGFPALFGFSALFSFPAFLGTTLLFCPIAIAVDHECSSRHLHLSVVGKHP
jgi:hypothetical protein